MLARQLALPRHLTSAARPFRALQSAKLRLPAILRYA
jgi:hypothetical protein